MIQLQKARAIVDADDVRRLQSAFAENHCVALPQLLDPGLLEFVQRRVERQPWIRRTEEGIATEDVLEDELCLSLLHFVTNTPRFLEAVSHIGGSADLSLFRGRVYRFIPHSAHHDSWHDDVGDKMDQRLIGMSVNLGPRAYAGGAFQLRDFASKRMLAEVANTGWGDAILFRISLQLEHQVTPVTGSEPRMAFAGWFRAGAEDFYSSLRRAAGSRP